MSGTQSRPTNLNHEREGWLGGVCGRCGAHSTDHQLGLESTPEQYVRVMTQVFREVKRVLRSDGLLFLVIGDSYVANLGNTAARPGYDNKAANGGANLAITRRPYLDVRRLKEKNLIGIPWRLALALQRSGWILRSEIIWHKSNPMPESVKDRPTRSHEQIFLLSKSEHYFYDMDAVKEARTDQRIHGEDLKRNARSVWQFATKPFSGAHFACFPPELVHRCLLAGTPRYVCAVCKKPWRHQREVVQSWRETAYVGEQTYTAVNLRARAHSNGMSQSVYRDNGFAPTCTCLGGIDKSMVLDPFCGSGTTLLVARELGHHAIGVDLSWPYLDTIARKRLGYSL